MTVTNHRRATYEDLMKVPENLVAEIIDGELYTWRRPRPRHSRASSSLGYLLGPPFDRGEGGPGGWWILHKPQLHAAENVLVPDLAGWRRERMSELPDEVGITIPPDWVCELLSPDTARIDRTKKLRVYALNGVPLVWLLDPLQRTLEVLHLEGSQWLILAIHGGDDKVRAKPFDAIEINLLDLWGP